MKNKNYILEKTTTILLLVSILFLTAPQQGNSQVQQVKRYALVEYMKVKPENIEKYLELEKSFWKPIHEERIAQKEIVGWRLFRVRYTGTDNEYNFVTGTFFDDVSKLEKAYNIDIQKKHPGRNIDDIVEEIYKVCDLVKTNLLVVNNETVNNTTFKYLQVNFMNIKQGAENEYLEVENAIWKPVHQDLVNTGAKAGWSLWSLVYPGGSGTEYQFIAVDDYANFSQLWKADYESAFSKVHEKRNAESLMDETNKSRLLVRSELWEAIDFSTEK